jgi:hypothetical protein
LDALIIATNSQNAIRPEDLLSNDPIQIALQGVYRDYGIAYERKEGESLPSHSMTFSKEQAAMAYLGVFMGYSSKLRNSLARREFFREGDDYYRAFNLRGPDGDAQPGQLPDGFIPDEHTNRKALQILVARCLEEICRNEVAGIQDKHDRGSLRKGAYYLARIVYLRNKDRVDKLIIDSGSLERKAGVARQVVETVNKIGSAAFDQARQLFAGALTAYLKTNGGNEDAALKNSEFARQVDALATKASAPNS